MHITVKGLRLLHLYMPKADTRVPCSTETRDKVLYPLKQPGESYDDLLRRLADTHQGDE